MEAPRTALHERDIRKTRRRRILVAIAALLVVAIVVIVVAVIFSKKRQHGLESTILVPLYIYPANGSWDSLYKAIGSRPNLNFTAIINPSSGPGNASTPGADYVAAIQKLNSFSNVQSVGYVHTSLATRPIDEVLADISVYTGWSHTTNLTMHGIFFDEMPVNYSAATADYVGQIDVAVKTSQGISSPRLVLHNPGAVPDPRLVLDTTDVTISFEGDYNTFVQQQATLSSLPQPRSRYGVVVHSTPPSAKLEKLVGEMSHVAQSLFLTDLDENAYADFGSTWTSFVRAVRA
ncbi:hypothetical protein LTR86_004345 [Recurvomyces mirabilis]|nr:hypothetical protein LTR86_004345 [Recurvomyces mirabilis]